MTTLTVRSGERPRHSTVTSHCTALRARASGCPTLRFLLSLSLWASIALLLLQGCSGAYGPSIPDPDGGTANDSDAGLPDGGLPSLDEFTPVDDPAVVMCGPDGEMSAPTGEEDDAFCPPDKNLSGCPCPEPGKSASCWPGKRVNRNQGICQDGQTTCYEEIEFGPLWGTCEGYVLPEDGATTGPEACRCFSNGEWKLENVVPCIFDESNEIYLLSSHPDGNGGFTCNSVSEVPPKAPAEAWTESTLKIDCAGSFELCYTLKAGNADNPMDDDCVLTRTCVDIWYEKAGEKQNLPALPSWATSDTACAERFVNSGGYGEMSVRGTTIECTPVDDGDGEHYVFNRVAYCRPDCDQTPDAEECKACAVGGSGNF